MADGFKIYGFPGECQKFDGRHPLWNGMMPNLERALNLAFTRVQTMSLVADKVVYFLGRACARDFMEILLVCYHGHGTAAAKLLRSMYEHTVTLRYIHENPSEAELFKGYHPVQQDKLLSRLIETFGPEILPAKTIEETRRRAAAARQKYTITDCEKCGTMRVNHTWSKLDFVAMAKKTGGGLDKLVLPGYYFPLRHAHPTFAGLSEGFEIVNGTLTPGPDSNPELADRSLTTAHNCILNVLEVQNEHFKIEGLTEAIQVCLKDWVRIWSPDSSLLTEDPVSTS
jgi:hypothetical protein